MTTPKTSTQKPTGSDDLTRKEQNSVVNEVAEETKGRHSNGNRHAPTTGKGGGAERGGTDLDKAAERQPPDSAT